MEKIQPIMPQEFTNKLQTKKNLTLIDYLAFFRPCLEQAINFAIGPFCWYIPDTRTMKIIAVSDNIRQLTPYTQQEWLGQDVSFLAANIHPDDCNYVLGATALAADLNENLPVEKRGNLRINIYGRMLDANRNYRWTLIQYPDRYFNSDGKIESTVSMLTDLSHFDLIKKPMMTVIDNNNKECQYFKVNVDTKKISPFALPNITKREQEILKLMARGLNTPKIATALFLSYHTVEKHKRNLREKTSTQTSAELMSFVCSNNLF